MAGNFPDFSEKVVRIIRFPHFLSLSALFTTVVMGDPYVLLATVGQTFLSAKRISTTTADRNVRPTQRTVVDLPRVVSNAIYPRRVVGRAGTGPFFGQQACTIASTPSENMDLSPSFPGGDYRVSICIPHGRPDFKPAIWPTTIRFRPVWQGAGSLSIHHPAPRCTMAG